MSNWSEWFNRMADEREARAAEIGSSSAPVELTDAEKAVLADRDNSDDAGPDEVTGDGYVRAPWLETGEHPNHPEVAGQPDPNG